MDDDDSRDEITGVVTRVEGVGVVMNQMKTDEDVMTAWQCGARKPGAVPLRRPQMALDRAGAGGGCAVGRWHDCSPVIRRRCWLPSSQHAASVGGGIAHQHVSRDRRLLLALAALKLTHVVLSILGLSAVVGLAVGFAFRDITENFIASVLLGLRRPFQIGDYVTVSGQSGVVKSLNTRATVLVTLEGNHVRIPNSVIFKEIMVNSTASPSFRNSFDVVIPYEASTAAAIEAISAALRGLKAILADPPPRTLVEALEPGGVRVRAYFWTPTQGVDWFQLMSDAKLKGKVALQASGVIPPAATENKAAAGAGTPSGENGQWTPSVTAVQARANIERDARKASGCGQQPSGADRARARRAGDSSQRGGDQPARGASVR